MPTSPQRKYDKGEKRVKHQGRGPTPEIRFSRGNPKFFVELCPGTMTLETRERLLKEAIAAPSGDREIDYTKYLYVVDGDGTIYEAVTSDAGISYHGYPYRGALPKGLLEKLRQMAEAKKCLEAFSKWVKTHILN